MQNTFPAAVSRNFNRLQEAAGHAAHNLSARAHDANVARQEMLRRIVQHCKEFQGVHLHRSLGQAGLSLALYGGIIAVMIALASVGYWPLALLLSPLAGGLLIKLFIIQHDCGHGSYFENRRANLALGFFISILTFTPYAFWRDAHNRHHASSGDLDRRGVGGVDTLTVEEYRALSLSKRIMYRLYRHPMVMIVIGASVFPAVAAPAAGRADALRRSLFRHEIPSGVEIGARAQSRPDRFLRRAVDAGWFIRRGDRGDPGGDGCGVGRVLAVLRPAPV